MAYGGNDTIYGGSGNDSLYGYDGGDSIYGEAGDDYVLAGDGANRVYGGDGADTVYGGADGDTVHGDAGNDYIVTYGGADSVYGSAGLDTVYGGDGADYVSAGDDNDYVVAGDGANTVYGDAGNDTLYGGANDDYLSGSDGDDSLIGYGGNDTLYGRAGNDTLYGGDGDDWLEAGSASETASGGAGTNWNAHQWSVGGTDRADVNQGAAHTCSLMSTLAAASYQGIDLTANITYQGNYHYTVRMFDTALNQWVSIGVDFDGTLLKNADGKNVDPDPVTVSSQGTTEFWTVLYQRAYLDYFQGKVVTDVDSVMSFTSDPDCAKTMKNVLGVATSTEGMPWFAEDLRAKLDAGQVVNAGGTGHRYSVLEVFQDAGVWKVELFNPRAYDGTHDPDGKDGPLTSFPIEPVGADDGVFYVKWSDFTNPAYFTNYTFSR
jgi:Ca2+-binding RTX toxin-like protein